MLFHAGFCRGGYIGVDIFFVISGYLICSIILDSLQANTFSFAKFYERRARRILPALYLVALLSCGFAYLLMNKWQLKNFGASLISVLFFSSNFYFWQGSNYFSEAQELIPLLHTWSLAVEEQFYLIFPLLLVLVWKYIRKYMRVILLFLFICSIVTMLCWGDSENKITNFFLLPSRVWELMLGAMLAYQEAIYSRQATSWQRKLFPLLGMLAIIWSILYFNAYTHHPGLITLIPALGVAAIIWYGGGGDLVTQVLATKYLVGIGLISYSLYLWHVPILVFFRMHNAGELSLLAKIVYIPLSMCLAYASWRWLEKPFRNRQLISMRVLYESIIIVSIVLFILGWFFVKNIIKPELLLPESVYVSLQGIKNECKYKNADDWFCTIGKPKSTYDFVVVGDSHAKVSIRAISSLALENNTYGIGSTYPACEPIFTQSNIDIEKNHLCGKLRQTMFDFVAKNKIKNVLLVARWSAHEHRIDWNIEAANKLSMEIEQRLKYTIEKYNTLGARVFILLQVPEQKFPSEVYKAIYRLPLNEREAKLKILSTNYLAYLEYNKRFNRSIQQIDANLVVMDPSRFFCSEGICPIGTVNSSYYSDDDHLSVNGNRLLKPLLSQTFNQYIIHK